MPWFARFHGARLQAIEHEHVLYGTGGLAIAAVTYLEDRRYWNRGGERPWRGLSRAQSQPLELFV